MLWALLRRGLLIGALAGLLAGLFGLAVGESRVQRAIDVEQRQLARGAGTAPRADEQLVSRDGQRAGLPLATTLYGAFLGGLFACAFAVARGRVGAASDWQLSTRLAAALFAALVLIPFLKYPANPPAVGDPATIGQRTAAYLVLLAACLLALLAGVRAARAVRADAAPWARPLVAGATFLGTVVLAMVLLPAAEAVPASFPSDLLWEFRLTSLGTQLVLWATLGTGFGVLTHRAAARAPERA